jgi:hypothetical protein
MLKFPPISAETYFYIRNRRDRIGAKGGFSVAESTFRAFG